jgi:hypothetical protein
MAKKYMHRTNADVGLVMAAYNLRRIINILGIEVLRNYLKHVIDCCIDDYMVLLRF